MSGQKSLHSPRQGWLPFSLQETGMFSLYPTRLLLFTINNQIRSSPFLPSLPFHMQKPELFHCDILSPVLSKETQLVLSGDPVFHVCTQWLFQQRKWRMKPGAVCVFETPLLAPCHPEMRLPTPGPGPSDSLPLPPVCSVLTASAGNPLVRSRGRAPEIRVWVGRADCGFNKTRFASGRRGPGGRSQGAEACCSWPFLAISSQTRFSTGFRRTSGRWRQAGAASALHLDRPSLPQAKEGMGGLPWWSSS